MPQPTAVCPLALRDQQLAKQALVEAVTELAQQGLKGEPLKQRSREIAEALHAGLAALSDSSATGSTRPASGEPQ